MPEISFLSLLSAPVKGALYAVVFAATVSTWGLFWLPAAAIVQPLSYPLFQKIVGHLGAAFFTIMVFAIRNIHGVEFVITGDAVRPNESALFFCNHRTRLDWYVWPSFINKALFPPDNHKLCHLLCCRMFLWYPLLQYDSLQHLKIVLKEDLRRIPLVGHGAAILQYMFLKRQWEHDQIHMKSMCRVYKTSKAPYKLLVFPEGTDLSEKNIKLSHEYAEQHNLPKYKQVLHPKTTGSCFLFKNLAPLSGVSNSEAHISAIYDAIIAYDGVIPQQEKCLFSGKMPKRVHIHIERYSVQGIMEKCKSLVTGSSNSAHKGGEDMYSEGLSTWIKKKFEFKDQILTEFYEQSEQHRLLQTQIERNRKETRQHKQSRKKFRWPKDTIRPSLVLKILAYLALLPLPVLSHIIFFRGGLWWIEVSLLTLILLMNVLVLKIYGGWDILATASRQVDG